MPPEIQYRIIFPKKQYANLGQGSDTGVPSRHSLRSLKIFELYLDMQIISCIIVDGLALLNFLFNYLHYVLGGTGSADRK